jgi:hypothetical protein
MELPATNAEVFDFFKRRWVFEKLSGFDEPTFASPRLVSDYFLERKPGIMHGGAWGAFLYQIYRQLCYASLLERDMVAIDNSKLRISKFAADLFHDAPEFLDKLVEGSVEIDWVHTREGAYKRNEQCGWRATKL